MKNQYFKLSANQEEGRAVVGNYIKCVSATGPIRIRVEGRAIVDLETGQGFSLPDPFDKFTVIDESGAINTVNLIVGLGKFDNDSISGSVGATITQGQTISEATPVTCSTTRAKILDADSGRMAITFRNKGATDIYLGSSTVTAVNAAIVLAPGEEYREAEAAAAEWHGITASGSGDVAALEVSA